MASFSNLWISAILTLFQGLCQAAELRRGTVSQKLSWTVNSVFRKAKSASDLPTSLTAITLVPYKAVMRSGSLLSSFHIAASLFLCTDDIYNSARVGSYRGKFKTTTIPNVEIPDWITSA